MGQFNKTFPNQYNMWKYLELCKYQHPQAPLCARRYNSGEREKGKKAYKLSQRIGHGEKWKQLAYYKLMILMEWEKGKELAYDSQMLIN